MPEGVLLPGFRIPAKWNYITELFEFQNKTGFRLGNRLTRNHAYDQRNEGGTCSSSQKSVSSRYSATSARQVEGA